jgi:hypothetical protein
MFLSGIVAILVLPRLATWTARRPFAMGYNPTLHFPSMARTNQNSNNGSFGVQIIKEKGGKVIAKTGVLVDVYELMGNMCILVFNCSGRPVDPGGLGGLPGGRVGWCGEGAAFLARQLHGQSTVTQV